MTLIYLRINYGENYRYRYRLQSFWELDCLIGNHFVTHSMFRCVLPRAEEICAVHPVFARVVGELQAADPSKCPRAHEAKC